MRILHLSISVILFFPMGAQCDSSSAADSLPVAGTNTLTACIRSVEDMLGKTILRTADHAYIYVFRNGYNVYFAQNAIGAFGVKSKEYKPVVTCGVTGGEVVYLKEPRKEAVIESGYPLYEYNRQGVVELLFKRKMNGEFEYCCSQLFDEQNIKKNNPDDPCFSN